MFKSTNASDFYDISLKGKFHTVIAEKLRIGSRAGKPGRFVRLLIVPTVGFVAERGVESV